jgi:tetratricopeptide (TPR) repeat protein
MKHLFFIFLVLLTLPTQAQPTIPISNELVKQWLDSCIVGGQIAMNYNFSETEVRGNVFTKAEQKANNDARRQVLTKQLATQPDNIGVYVELHSIAADSTERKAYKEKCLQLIAQGLEKDGNNGELYYKRATVLQFEFKFEEAFQDLVSAQSLMPDSAKVYRKAGELFFMTMQYTRAMEVFQKAVSLDNSDIGLHVFNEISQIFNSMLGLVEAEGQGKKIIEAAREMKQDFSILDKAIAQYPKRQDLKDLRVFSQAFWIFYKGFMTGAVLAEQENKLVGGKKKLIALDKVFYITDNDKIIIKDLEKKLIAVTKRKDFTKPSLAYETIGLLATLMGDEKKAMLNIEKAIKINPEKGSNYQNIAFIHAVNKRFEKAKQMLQRKMVVSETVEDYLALAGMTQDEKKYAEAVEICKKGFEKFPNNADLHAFWAMIEVRLENYASAREHLQQATILDSSKSEYMYKRALVNMALKDWEGAKRALDLCESREPKAKEILEKYFAK